MRWAAKKYFCHCVVHMQLPFKTEMDLLVDIPKPKSDNKTIEIKLGDFFHKSAIITDHNQHHNILITDIWNLENSLPTPGSYIYITIFNKHRSFTPINNIIKPINFQFTKVNSNKTRINFYWCLTAAIKQSWRKFRFRISLINICFHFSSFSSSREIISPKALLYKYCLSTETLWCIAILQFIINMADHRSLRK